jgi:hypothetical protein
LEFVPDIKAWCQEHGIPEDDPQKPLKVVSGPRGCKLLLREHVPQEVLQERLKALDLRHQLHSVAQEPAKAMDSPEKVLSYLFLSEFAHTIADIGEDELLADEWALKEMQRLGLFRT